MFRFLFFFYFRWGPFVRFQRCHESDKRNTELGHFIFFPFALLFFDCFLSALFFSIWIYPNPSCLCCLFFTVAKYGKGNVKHLQYGWVCFSFYSQMANAVFFAPHLHKSTFMYVGAVVIFWKEFFDPLSEFSFDRFSKLICIFFTRRGSSLSFRRLSSRELWWRHDPWKVHQHSKKITGKLLFWRSSELFSLETAAIFKAKGQIVDSMLQCIFTFHQQTKHFTMEIHW